ncbi:MAG: peptidylprolyl isomerase [Bacteroidota bacterium]
MHRSGSFRFYLPVVTFLLTLSMHSSGQEVLDQVMATVGGQIVLKSEIERQYVQMLAQGGDDPDAKCGIFDQLILQKLMLNQAQLDSITVSETQIEGELDRRMRFYIRQIGSEEALEAYFKTSIRQLKDELRDAIKDQLTVQNMQSKITKDVTVTPNEVRAYFESIPPDSLPYMDAELEIAQILRTPPVSDAEKQAIRARLEEFRAKIATGDDFAVYAALYSQDPGSAKKGGELGFFERGMMVPEFEAAAFNLKPGEMSMIIETKYGFHLLQLIERRGNQINVRHILLQPKISDADLYKCVNYLDSLKQVIESGRITFEEAAQKYSDDDETKNSGGMMVNPETNTTRLSPDKIDRVLFFQVDTMQLGKISPPLLTASADGKNAYRIVTVKSRSVPHKANLKDDYQKIQEVALSEKQNKMMSEWVEKKRKTTFIQINTDDFANCSMLDHWRTTDVKSGQ